MKLITSSLLLVACAASAVAFDGSAVFLLDSGSTPNPLIPQKALSFNANDLMNTISPVIEKCSAKCYLLVDQPELHVESESLSPAVKSSLQSPENAALVQYVFGGVDLASIAKKSASACKADVMKVAGSSSTDSVDSKENDAHTVILVDGSTAEAILWVEKVRSVFGKDYVIMVGSSIVTQKVSSNLVNLAVNGTATLDASSPLLSRYMIFSPAIWMGFLVSFILVSISLVGILLLQSIKTPLRFEQKPKAL